VVYNGRATRVTEGREGAVTPISMKVIPSELPEVLFIEPKVYTDERGFFLESYHAQRYARHGLPEQFVQDNSSQSRRGVLRGLHYQLHKPQGKLVQVVRGEVFDVAVDIRTGSPNFCRWVGVVLSEENHRQIYIPPGFAHGYCVLSDSADLLYKCTEYYDAADEFGIIWNDPDIDIKWPSLEFLISEKDQQNLSLQNLEQRLPVYTKGPG